MRLNIYLPLVYILQIQYFSRNMLNRFQTEKLKLFAFVKSWDHGFVVFSLETAKCTVLNCKDPDLRFAFCLL